MNYLDDYDTQIQCEEYYGDEPLPEDYEHYEDDEDMLDTQYDQDAILDDDLEDFVDLNADLFDANGGLTADAYAMLAEMDSAGAFI